MAQDWFEWHQVYTNPRSRASLRLEAVQTVLRQAIDEMPPGPFEVLSLCAGQGHDILGVLADHPRRDDARVTLVEADPRNVEQAVTRGREIGVAHVDGVVGDAGLSDTVDGAPRASLLLLVGMVAHIDPSDFVRLIAALPQLCEEDAVVVWNRRPRLGTSWSARKVRTTFAAAGFVSASLTIPRCEVSEVCVERFVGTPQPLVTGRRWFTFVATPRRPSPAQRAKRRAARLVPFG